MRRGHRRSNFVWYHPLDEAGVADLCREQRTPQELHHIPFDTLFREVGAALSDISERAEPT